jgi:hypothetical protein
MATMVPDVFAGSRNCPEKEDTHRFIASAQTKLAADHAAAAFS